MSCWSLVLAGLLNKSKAILKTKNQKEKKLPKKCDAASEWHSRMSSSLQTCSQTHAHLYTHGCVPPLVHKIRPVIVDTEPTEVKDMAPIPLFPAGDLRNASLLKENDLVPCISKVWVLFLCFYWPQFIFSMSPLSLQRQTEKDTKRKTNLNAYSRAPP